MKKQVLMDHDGAIDDFLALLLLLTMESVESLGIIVTPADCYPGAAASVTRKILELVGRPLPVAASTVRGINPFPPLFRRDSTIIDGFPLLNQVEILRSPLVAVGQQFLVEVLRDAQEPITLLVTGPLTTLAAALDLAPECEGKIAELVWMGGALAVPGNVEKIFAAEQDGSAEWNAYWDPLALQRVWQSQIPIVLCPLDITNTVPMTREVIQHLTRQRHYTLSDLAGLCYALAVPQNYYCWDILATAYLARPDLYRVAEVETAVIAEGPSQGRTLLQPGGRPIRVLQQVDRQGFFAYVLQQFAQAVPLATH